MKCKKYITLFFLLVTVLAIVRTGVLGASPGPQVRVSLLKYSPTPAEPGSVVDVWLQLTSPSVPVDDVELRLVDDFPFSVPNGQTSVVSVGRIAGAETKVVKFSLLVDSSAPNGVIELSVYHRYAGSVDWIKSKVVLSLQSQSSLLVVDSFSSAPEKVLPGQRVDISIALKNNGRVGVKDVDVSLDLSGSKFSILGGGTKKRIDSITIGESAVASFSLIADASADVKVYDIPVLVSYLDEKNKKFSDTSKIGLVVSAPAEVSILVDDTSFQKVGVPTTVSLKVVNKGVGELKYVSVSLLESSEYEVLSLSDSVYVGNLDSDDFETVQFLIKPLVENPVLQVGLSFKDPYNVDGSLKSFISLRKKQSVNDGSSCSGWTWIVLLIVAGVGFWFWRRKKQKQSQKR